MTIYRTRYRDPSEHRWVSACAETRAGAEMRRTGSEKRFAPRKVEVAVKRFEVNPSKPELVRFLNEHVAEELRTVSHTYGRLGCPVYRHRCRRGVRRRFVSSQMMGRRQHSNFY